MSHEGTVKCSKWLKIGTNKAVAISVLLDFRLTEMGVIATFKSVVKIAVAFL
jgi:hypothetical protein